MITVQSPMATIRKLILAIALFYSLQNYAIGQLDSIPQWIQKVYESKSENLDSFRTEIFKQNNKGISIYQFKNYLGNIFKQDSFLPTMVKTIYVLNVIFKNMDTTLLKQIDYETRYYYYYLMQKMYVLIGAKNFPIYKQDYNNVFTIKDLFIRKMNQDTRTVSLFYKYFSIRPEWIGEKQLRTFRYDSTYQYNDLIVDYILKSPDSVDWKNISYFGRTLSYEAMYTLAFFNDERVIPYLERMVLERGVNPKNYLLSEFLRPWEGNEGEKIQLALCRAVLNRKDVLEKKEFQSGLIVGHKIKYSGLTYIFSTIKRIFPKKYEQLKNIQDEKEQLAFVKNLVDKRLQELDNKK